MGNTPKYAEWLEPDNLLRIEEWAKCGLGLDQIAHNMGIATGTLCKWKNDHNELNEAIKRGKRPADLIVENALFKSACGYDVEETTEELRFNKTTHQYEMIVVKKQKKHIPPSNTAQIFWLKNRCPDRWRDKIETKTTLVKEETDLLSQAFEEITTNGIQYETNTDISIPEK